MKTKKKSGLADSPFFTPPPQPATTGFDPSSPETASASPTPLSQPACPDQIIETLRRAVKDFGKEAATHRFTLQEKKAIMTIVHELQMQGTRTSENEITRIAVNFTADDYHHHGSQSLLARVLQALHQ